MADDLSIARDFPAVSPDDWRLRVEAELEGTPIESLRTDTLEGIPVEPLYALVESQPDDPSGYPGLFPFVRGRLPLGTSRDGWDIRQEYDHPDVEQTARDIAADVEHGVTSVWLQIGIERGIRVLSPGDVATVLAPLDLARHAVSLEAESDVLPVAAAVVAVARSRGVDEEQLRGSWGADPFGTLARTGTLPAGLRGELRSMEDLVLWSRSHTPGVRSVHVTTVPYREAGGTAVHELAYALSTGVEYLRRLEQAGLSIAEAAREMVFVFSIGGDFFMEVAKLRAARLLWAKVLAAAAVTSEPMVIHARTSPQTKTRRDPWVNVLRGTVEAFAAAIGGADSIATAPFDEVIGPPDRAARRLARNTQLVLRDEAQVHRVVDPAGGSFYVEHLTAELARRGWRLFQETERVGGMAKALVRGQVLAVVSRAAEARQRRIASREQPIVGVSEFPDLAEERLHRAQPSIRDIEGHLGREFGKIDPEGRYAALLKFARLIANPEARVGAAAEAAVDAIASGVDLFSIATLMRTGRASLHTEPMRAFRVAEPWERLRRSSDHWVTVKGRRPRAYLVPLGGRESRERVAWVADLLSSGGVDALEGKAADSVEDAADGFADSGAEAAVICAVSERAMKDARSLAPRLRELGARLVLLAGPPGESVPDVDAALHEGADLLAVLARTHRVLGVST